MRFTKRTKLSNRILLWLLIGMFILVGGTDKEETEDKVSTLEDKDLEIADGVDEVESNPLEEDITFGGKVFVEDDRIRVMGESNLAEGTVVSGELYKSPFSEVRDSTTLITGEESSVDENGHFEMEFLYEKYSDMDFLERFNGSILEVELEVKMGYSQSDEIVELYGRNGDNLRGPIVYKELSFGELHQFLYIPIYVRIGGNQSEYVIEVPERSPFPEDYGDPKVRIDIEEITHDHEFFYVKGKTNLIEGTFLRGGYQSSEISKFPQGFYHNTTHVQPDGSFVFRADYHTLAEDGFIRIIAKPIDLHLASNILYDAYGEDFERIEGEYVTFDELDKKNEIEIILYPSIPEIEVPEETNVTEDDGEIKIQVPDSILFDSDKTEIEPDAKKTLSEIIEMLEVLEAGTKIQINGHTDSEGEPDDNKTLSENKARAVEAYLTGNGNIAHLDISTDGYGEKWAIAPNEDEEGRERNRRVEIVINPKDVRE
ncbi:OmpA family protein [Paucisalibacillus sp. EB02]|uniref:OmpA family protein n=1 Tax=Paucisalibacillus sp. EB02 TaxID=1347087 RepID=UPI000694500D|nr:OmpA family protein [Paucisalibacillus sp. EB02]